MSYRPVLALACMLIAMGQASAGAEIVTVPTLSAWGALTGIEQAKLESVLGSHVAVRLNAGLLAPGDEFDTEDPSNAFAIQWDRWHRALIAGEKLRTQGLHYPEIIEWGALQKRWRELERWQRRRYAQ